MPHWCLHPACLESLESFDSPAAVAAHMREAHDCGGDDADAATSSSKRLCLILDIDGTLLSDDCEDVFDITPAALRPGIHAFLDVAFSRCRAVGIWTAASDAWARRFVDVVGPRPWAFVWSGNRVSRRRLCAGDPGFYSVAAKAKPLKKVWRNRALRAAGYDRHTSLIIDDTPDVCAQNFGNAAYVRSYTGASSADDDDWLRALASYLCDLDGILRCGGTLRSIEKRGWYQRAAARRDRGRRDI